MIGQKRLFSGAYNSQIRPKIQIVAGRIILYSSKIIRKNIRSPAKNQHTRNCRGDPGGLLIGMDLPSLSMQRKRVELGDVTLVLPRWEAVHATGGGQRGAELRDDYYGGVSPSRRLPADWVGSTLGKQGGHQPKISGGPRSRYTVEKRWSTLQRWSIRGGEKVARRGHRWSQTGTAVSDGHPVGKFNPSDAEHRHNACVTEPGVEPGY